MASWRSRVVAACAAGAAGEEEDTGMRMEALVRESPYWSYVYDAGMWDGEGAAGRTGRIGTARGRRRCRAWRSTWPARWAGSSVYK